MTSFEFNILTTVCKEFDVRAERLFSKGKTIDIAYPRMVVMSILSRNGSSCAESAGLFNRDHSTAVYARRKVKDLYWTDNEFRARVNRIVGELDIAIKIIIG